MYSFFLIIKLTGSNPKISLVLLWFLLFSLTPHVLISVWFSFNSCSTFIGRVSLPCIRQLTQVAYTLPLSFNKNLFPVRMGKHSQNLFQADLTDCYYWITSSICIQHFSQTTEFIYLFQWFPITNIQMQISIKPICDWPIYTIASADEFYIFSDHV